MFAYEISKVNPSSSIAIIEKGKHLKDRKCPINLGMTDKCLNCEECAIMSGIAGGGAFSDAKFNITTEYGGWINEYISNSVALYYMNKLDYILKLMNSKSIEAMKNKTYIYNDDIFKRYKPNDELKKKALENDLHLLQGEVSHFGTDGIYNIMINLEEYLLSCDNVDFYCNTNIRSYNIDLNNKLITNNENEKFIFHNLILAVGRSGSAMFKDFCEYNGTETFNNQIDIGVRVEVPRIICENVSKQIYEPKIKYLTKKHRDIVRTFCFNSGGEVVTENTDGILTVNGHANSNEKLKTENSNFAILSTHNFTEPFNEPIEYLQNVARLANMLGGDKIISQLFGDLIDGRRSTEKRISESTVKPTLKSHTPGDLSLVIPSAAMDNIIEMIYQLDKFMPGIANHDTILYGVEAKYYSCRPKFIDKSMFKIHEKNVYAIGDGAGVSRSLSQAGAMGLYLADMLNKNILGDTSWDGDL